MSIVRFSKGVAKFPDVAGIAEQPIGLSQLGTPVYDSIVIPAVTYDNTNGKTITTPPLTLIDALINVSLQRNISVTKIVGRSGSVKEFISNGDYEINVNGRIVSPIQAEPTGELYIFNQIMRIEKEIPAYSKYLFTTYGITDIVIVGKPTIQQVEGSRNTYNYSFRALSYEEIELEVIDNA